MNADVSADSSLEGKTQKVTVNMKNSQADSFETIPVKFQLESLDKKTNIII